MSEFINVHFVSPNGESYSAMINKSQICYITEETNVTVIYFVNGSKHSVKEPYSDLSSLLNDSE